MKRVLIVDDEYLVRLGLKSTINWNAYGYEIAGEAANGKEALEQIDRINPDILMMDIKMPVMDGLELLEEVKRRGLDVQLVILSNHDDFSFARKAMELGATRYLLKSEINEANLVEILQTLSIEAGEKPMQTDDKDAARRQYLQSQLIGVPANAPISPNQLQPPAPGLFTCSPYVAIKCSCTIDQAALATDMPMQTLNSIVRSSLDLPEAVHCTSIYKDVVYLTFVGSASGITHKRLNDICILVTRNIKNYLGVDLHIGVSSFLDAAQMPLALSQAEQARSDSFFTGKNVTFFEDTAPASAQKRIKVSHRKIKSFVQAGEREGLFEYIGQIFVQLRELRSYAAMHAAFVDFISVAKSICEESSLDLTTGLHQDKFDYDVLSKMSALENAHYYVVEIYNTLLTALSDKKNHYSHTISRCLQYIAESYEEPITLEDAAKAVNISTSYLSMTFKQETGISFVSYLTRFRIQHSEKLLAETSMKIYEIAEKVGFSSPYYFSKVFKEQMGISCKEYRDRHVQTSAHNP